MKTSDFTFHWDLGKPYDTLVVSPSMDGSLPLEVLAELVVMKWKSAQHLVDNLPDDVSGGDIDLVVQALCGRDTCGYCRAFNVDDCGGCPVFLHIEHDQCRNTPINSTCGSALSLPWLRNMIDRSIKLALEIQKEVNSGRY